MKGYVTIKITISDKRSLKLMAEFVKREDKYWIKTEKPTGFFKVFKDSYCVYKNDDYSKYKRMIFPSDSQYTVLENTNHSQAIIKLNNLYNCDSSVHTATIDDTLAFHLNNLLRDFKSNKTPLYDIIGYYYV